MAFLKLESQPIALKNRPVRRTDGVTVARAKNEEHFLPVLIPLRTSEYLEFEVYIIPTGAYTPKNELLHYLSKRPVNQDEYFVVLRVSPSR